MLVRLARKGPSHTPQALAFSFIDFFHILNDCAHRKGVRHGLHNFCFASSTLVCSTGTSRHQNLVLSDAVEPLGLTILTQQIAKQIRHGDYIPKGGLIPEKTLRFELIPPTHVYRCCQQTGNDMQSGPYYCGEIATYAAAVPGGHVALCDVHMQKRSETIRSALIEQDN